MNIFECNICLERAEDAVLSICGHVFCWPCLHQWFMMRPFNKRCPVCRTPIDRDNVIPLFGENNKFPHRATWLSRIWSSTRFRYFIRFWLLPICFLIISSYIFQDPRIAGINGDTMLFKEQILWKLILFIILVCIRWLILAQGENDL